MTAISPHVHSSENVTLIDLILAEQQRLTPLDRLAVWQERKREPSRARHYRELIPDGRPGRGQQYAFAVDLDLCSGCKSCVTACHSLNGLDEGESWRSVGVIHGVSESGSFQQHITSACHHCLQPGCLEGCPVGAYEKDIDTGIVRHLDDQCIGCQYCMMKCPYDVPKYSERLGIVRKCDMCTGRLEQGEAPACVQACPHGAIEIRIVDTQEVQQTTAPGSAMLPGAFDSSHTRPATAYRLGGTLSMGALVEVAAARREHAHWPLIFMLVLTQLSVGAFSFSGLVSDDRLRWIGWIALHLGLGASVFHLGRPMGAWRFFLGLRTSWMSREILAFMLLSIAATGCVLGDLVPWWAVAMIGWLAVATSAMIYVDTRRPCWRAEVSFGRFIGSVLMLGLATLGGIAALAIATAAVLIERYFFFTKAQAPRMPGEVL